MIPLIMLNCVTEQDLTDSLESRTSDPEYLSLESGSGMKPCKSTIEVMARRTGFDRNTQKFVHVTGDMYENGKKKKS